MVPRLQVKTILTLTSHYQRETKVKVERTKGLSKAELVNLEGHPYDSRERLPDMDSGTLPLYSLCSLFVLDNST